MAGAISQAYDVRTHGSNAHTPSCVAPSSVILCIPSFPTTVFKVHCLLPSLSTSLTPFFHLIPLISPKPRTYVSPFSFLLRLSFSSLSSQYLSLPLSPLSLHLSCLTSSTCLLSVLHTFSYTRALFHPSLLLSLSVTFLCFHICSTCPTDHQCEGCLCTRTYHYGSRCHHCGQLHRGNSG